MMGDQIIIITERVAASIRDELGCVHPLSSNRCIYRVPEHLRQVNEEAYRPWVVSIGPFYSQDPRLNEMQEKKMRYLQEFLRRGSAYSLEHYINYVTEREQKAREYYAEELSLSRDEFIKMLLLDAAFIIVFFTVGSAIVQDQKIEVFHQVGRDLFLEENQVPFFILKGLYDLAIGTNSSHLTLIHAICESISNVFKPDQKVDTVCEKIINTSTIMHLVDLLRICFLPSTLREQRHPSSNDSSRGNNKIVNRFPMSASELSAAGVKFVASQISDLCGVRYVDNLLDVRFDNGVLEIPKFTVDHSTESAFRSIVLLEQCHYYFNSYVVDYIIFLDHLINTPKDVQILVEKGIIENWLGSNEEVAHLFNNIAKHASISASEFYYSDVSGRLNEYATTRWNQWRAILKSNYFNHPWAIISIIYAVVLLILTTLQTYSSFNSKN